MKKDLHRQTDLANFLLPSHIFPHPLRLDPIAGQRTLYCRPLLMALMEWTGFGFDSVDRE